MANNEKASKVVTLKNATEYVLFTQLDEHRLIAEKEQRLSVPHSFQSPSLYYIIIIAEVPLFFPGKILTWQLYSIISEFSVIGVPMTTIFLQPELIHICFRSLFHSVQWYFLESKDCLGLQP